MSWRSSLLLLVAFSSVLVARQSQPAPAEAGSFVLFKFAHAVGRENYTIRRSGGLSTLESSFLFTDRGSKVPLQTTFQSHTGKVLPLSFNSKGKISRGATIDDRISVQHGTLDIMTGHTSRQITPKGAWFIFDGYSPVAMQEQMMRWWMRQGRPTAFTAFPSGAEVRINPAETLTVAGTRMHGFTVSGLIWGQECLWMDDAGRLTALVSTDAEFDHFEAVREAYASHLSEFISAAVPANLRALNQLTAGSVSSRPAILAIVGVTIEDVTGAAPIRDGVIVIDHGVITAQGPRHSITIPQNATVLDAAGKYAIPGLWDMHAHYEQVEWGPIYLAAGVTTVRDCGNELDFIRVLHDALDQHDHSSIGPHLEFAGIIDGSGPMSAGAILADTPEQARAEVIRYRDAGARQIKIYSSVKPEVVQAITAQAHALGLTVTGHVPTGMTVLEALKDGMDQINHLGYFIPYFSKSVQGADGKPDRKVPLELDFEGERGKELIAALKQDRTVVDPTMVVYEAFQPTEPLDKLEPGMAFLPPELKSALEIPADASAVNVRFREAALGTLRKLHEAGIRIVAGTDQSIPGHSLHRELEIYVEAGFTPLEALQSATIVPAQSLGLDATAGSLAPGKRGDVVLLDADPLQDIRNTRRIWRTVAAGTVYEPAPLWRSVGFLPYSQ